MEGDQNPMRAPAVAATARRAATLGSCVLVVLAVVAAGGPVGSGAAQTATELVGSFDQDRYEVIQGNTASIGVTVSNPTDSERTDDVVLRVTGNDPLTTDQQTVTLAPGEQQELTFQWDSNGYDPASYDATLVINGSEKDVAAISVQEPQPATFDVQIDSTTSPVTEGDALRVDATVTNTGDESGSEEIVLRIGDFQEDVEPVSLGAGESTSLTLRWQTEAGDAGDYVAMVSSPDSFAERDVEVVPPDPPNFGVEVTSTTSPVTEGGTLRVDARITNTGDETGTAEVALAVAGTDRDATSVSLEGGASTGVTLAWQTGSGDAGDYTATVRTGDDSGSAPVRVRERTDPAYFDVQIDSTSSPVTEGDVLAVTATVTNTGEESDTQQVTLDVGDAEVAARRVTVGADDTRTLTLRWETSRGDAGQYTAAVGTDDATDRASVAVQPAPDPPDFAVSIDGTSSPVTTGEPIDVSATVTNTGGSTDTQQVSLSVAGQSRDAVPVTLEPGNETSLTLSWQTGAGDAGEYDLVVATANDSATATVRVREGGPPGFDVAIVASSSPVREGGIVDLTAAVTNTGERSDRQSIELAVDETVVDAADVRLTPGGSQRVTLHWETAAGDAGEYLASVASQTDSATREVAVRRATATDPGGAFAVVINATNADGDRRHVTAMVRNTGSDPDTQLVSLAVDGVERDRREVSLQPGEREWVTLDWNGSGTNASTVRVATEDDTDEAPVAAATGGSLLDDPLVILLLVALLVGVALAYAYVRRRGQKGSGPEAPRE